MKSLNILFLLISTTFGSIGLIGMIIQLYNRYLLIPSNVNESNLIGISIFFVCYIFILSFCFYQLKKERY